jgi:hypothetical protein
MRTYISNTPGSKSAETCRELLPYIWWRDKGYLTFTVMAFRFNMVVKHQHYDQTEILRFLPRDENSQFLLFNLNPFTSSGTHTRPCLRWVFLCWNLRWEHVAISAFQCQCPTIWQGSTDRVAGIIVLATDEVRVKISRVLPSIQSQLLPRFSSQETTSYRFYNLTLSLYAFLHPSFLLYFFKNVRVVLYCWMS